jgi:hypothetical protein
VAEIFLVADRSSEGLLAPAISHIVPKEAAVLGHTLPRNGHLLKG